METTQFHGTDDHRSIMAGTRRADGRTMSDGRLPAFLGLAKYTGGVYAEDQSGVTVDTALKAAGLDWATQVVEGLSLPLITADGVTTVEYPDHRGTVRVNPDGSASGLGVVKTKYSAVQNVEAGEYAQAIVDDFGANVVAVGAYGKPLGAKTYIAVRLDETMLVGGEDRHDLYLSVINDHVGGGGLTAVLAPIRFDCTNQTTATFGKAAMRMTIRHTGDTRGKAQAAREALDLTHRWVPMFLSASERMLDTALVDAEFEALIATVLPEPTGTTARSTNGYQAKVNGIREALTSPTNTYGQGSVYAAYNAFVEWADFGAPVNNDHLPESRYSRVMAGGFDSLKQRAFEACMALTSA